MSHTHSVHIFTFDGEIAVVCALCPRFRHSVPNPEHKFRDDLHSRFDHETIRKAFDHAEQHLVSEHGAKIPQRGDFS